MSHQWLQEEVFGLIETKWMSVENLEKEIVWYNVWSDALKELWNVMFVVHRNNSGIVKNPVSNLGNYKENKEC